MSCNLPTIRGLIWIHMPSILDTKKRPYATIQSGWAKASVSDFRVVHCGDEFYQGWAKAKFSFKPMASPPATRNSINWSPPISGHLKCNLDAGFAHGTNITEMGCCVRNHVVALVASYMNSRSPCMDVKEGET
ncbi:hypothetical protein JHK87_012675 [Glycine soja]|nr:hypothetical protein JHK87_012675 [Glycine soja]